MALITLVTLALYPDLDLPQLTPSGRHTDFIYHLTGFLVLTITALAATNRAAFVLASMVALALLLETLQIFIPGRGVYMSDVIASLTGVGLSWPLFSLFCRGRRWLSETGWLRSKIRRYQRGRRLSSRA